jgi:hypothetical protein
MGLLSTSAIDTNIGMPAVAAACQYPVCATKNSSALHIRPFSSSSHTARLSSQRVFCTSKNVHCGSFCAKLGWLSYGSIIDYGTSRYEVYYRKWQRQRWLLSVQMVEESKKELSQERQGILNHSLRRVASWISKKDDFQRRLLEQGLSFTQGYRKSHESLVDKDKVPNRELERSQVDSLGRTESAEAEVPESVNRNLETKYITSLVSAMATPPFPSVGDGLVGFGCVVFLAVAVVGWWRKLQSGSKASGTLQTNPQASEELQSAQAAVAAPVALSLLLQRDLKKKESAEWLNMVLGKIWNLYRLTLEGWLVELLQPLIDEIPEKPPLVQRVKITQFFLGDDPVTVRSIERRTSRRANDLQYHVGLRYSGNSRIAVSVALKLGFLPLTIPFGIRGLDLDGEMWVKLRLIPTEPWVGTATWAFLSLPKVTLAVAPFGILNLMAVPVLNIFLTKLLTRDLPLLFVRPNKSVVNFLQGKAVGPLSKDFKDGILLNGFAGELSVTLIEAQDLAYFPLGKVLCLYCCEQQVLSL